MDGLVAEELSPNSVNPPPQAEKALPVALAW
jgi:hypothetical protein